MERASSAQARADAPSSQGTYTEMHQLKEQMRNMEIEQLRVRMRLLEHNNENQRILQSISSLSTQSGHLYGQPPPQPHSSYPFQPYFPTGPTLHAAGWHPAPTHLHYGTPIPNGAPYYLTNQPILPHFPARWSTPPFYHTRAAHPQNPYGRSSYARPKTPTY